MRKLLKFIPIILISMLILQIIFANNVYAGSTGSEDTFLDNFVDGIAGLLLYPAKLLPVVLGGVISIVLGFFAPGATLSVDDIIFNRVPITNIDFFNLTSSATQNSNSTMLEIRQNVAIWYVSIRNLAAILLAIIVIYVGIRMAMSTIAEEKAKYKQMLYDWIFSLFTLFVIHYVMMFVIYINNALVALIGNSITASGNPADDFFKASWSIGFIKGMGNAIAYLMIEIITLVFLMEYITRMVRLAFLIIISPLVTVTYAIDRMGDGKSQALNTWFKEFVYNILIQPFHCVAYAALGTIAVDLLKQKSASGSSEPDLAAGVIGIVILVFIFKAEDIVKHIFHFESKSMGRTLARAALIGSAVGNITKATGKAKQLGENISNTRQIKEASKGADSAGGKGVGGDKAGAAGKGGAEGAGASGAAGAEGAAAGSAGGAGAAGAGAGGAGAAGASGGAAGAGAAGAAAGPLAVVAIAAQAVVNANKRAGRAAVGLAVGAGLGGDAKNVILHTSKGWKSGAASAASYSENIRSKQLAGAYEDYKNAHEGMSDDKAKEDAKALMDGTKQATTAEEIALRDRMLSMKDRYKYDGADDKEISKKLNKTLDKVGEGKISRLKTSQVFTGVLPKTMQKKADSAIAKMEENKRNRDEVENGGSDDEA